MNWDNCPDPKKSKISAFNGLVLSNDWEVKVSESWTVIFSFTILPILESPALICINNSSPTPLTRLLDKLSISSVCPFPLFRLITYFIVPIISSLVNNISSSGTLSFNLLFILYLPTGSRSYLWGLKNICLISDLADSTVTKSPGLNFLNTSVTASSFVSVLSFKTVLAKSLSSGFTSQ